MTQQQYEAGVVQWWQDPEYHAWLDRLDEERKRRLKTEDLLFELEEIREWFLGNIDGAEESRGHDQRMTRFAQVILEVIERIKHE